MVGHGVCEGTVVAFTTHGSKYNIQYTDGTTAMLTKTALTKILVTDIAPPISVTNVATSIVDRTTVVTKADASAPVLE